ncbi:MAG TPA: cation transporter [Bacteroidia bacterium]|nr:cation transporter [Bacteroidia bacterium]
MFKRVINLLCCFVLLSGAGLAQTATKNKTENIKVYGNCDMCKAVIEGALKKKDGVISKRWDKNTKMLTVTYDPSKITIKQIAEKVAAVGYDNEYATAPDSVYNKLHGCCHYERPKK